MTWRPSIGELVEVVDWNSFVVARVDDILNPGTKREMFVVAKDWGMPQFRRNYLLSELTETGLRIHGIHKPGA